MRIEFHPETVSDLNDAADYYHAIRPELADSFRNEIYETLERIKSSPLLHHPIRFDIRRCFVHRFPFSILYRIIEDDLIRILVIRHHRRHPEFGIEREET